MLRVSELAEPQPQLSLHVSRSSVLGGCPDLHWTCLVRGSPCQMG